jgi:hypothetical protein
MSDAFSSMRFTVKPVMSCYRFAQCLLMAWLEQNQSEYALLESLRGGFFLRTKSLEDIAFGYINSGFAINRLRAFKAATINR